jgi:hypothetical protein
MKIFVVAAIVVAALSGFWYWKVKQSALPKGIALGNGRIE